MKTRTSKRRVVETAVGAALGAAIAGPAGAIAGGLAAGKAASKLDHLGERRHPRKRTGSDADDPMIHARLQRILVPVDFSPASLGAVRFAGDWAARFRASVCLLHVMEPTHAIPFGSEMMVLPRDPPADVRKAIRCELEKLAHGHFPKSAKVSVQLREGSPHDQIVAAARKLRADIIIIASLGRSGVLRALMGSTAERVARHAPCPVLTLRSARSAAR